jgi:hypothetical protein
MVKDHIPCRCGGGTVADVIVTERYVAEEVVDGEDVLLMGIRDEELSVVAQVRSPKPYRLSHTRSQEMGSRGPLSRIAVHSARQDGEDLVSGAKL